MTWHCETHGAVTPDHYGTSYRCPLCTARAVWRDGCKCTLAQRVVGDGCDICNPELAAEIEAEKAEEGER